MCVCSLPRGLVKILAIDPGVNNLGVSVFDSRGLLFAFLLPVDSIASAGKKLLQPEYLLDNVTKAVIEKPQVYKVNAKGGDNNDLVDVARVVGSLEKLCFDAYGIQPDTPWPATWKKQVPKLIMIERIKERLNEYERTRVRLPRQRELAHNVWDAIGIGLWATGRL
jgi:hypothetical protein